MQVTKVIGKMDFFKNKFKTQGRSENCLILQLKDMGFSEFRERTLKDKSKVMLAYKSGKKLAEFACRIFPDLSIEQKYIKHMSAFFKNSHKLQIISKTFQDKYGETIKEYTKKMRYLNGAFVEKDERYNDYVKDILIVKEETPRGENDPNLKLKNIVKSYSRLKGDDIYSCYQQADGTRNYIKNIGGVEYKFSSK